jgi:hypothetical protein
MGPRSRSAQPDLRRVEDEARLLHERLRRVALALSMTEDVLADTYDRLANRGGPNADLRRLGAKRSRSAADECRAFIRRLDSLHAPEP